MKKKSKEDWLNTALELLENQGIHSITIINIAKALKISRSGFYWHFEDRDDLLFQLLKYWAHEYTEVVISNPLINIAKPRERLRKTAHAIIDYNLTKYDLQFRTWATEVPVVAREVNKVYKMRLDFLSKAFFELGFEGEEVEMRARLFICYHSWEQIMFWKESKGKLKKMIDSRIRLLTRKT